MNKIHYETYIKTRLNKNRTGLVVGSLYAMWHLVWAVLVLSGLGTFALNLDSYLHFLTSPSFIGDISLSTAPLLVLATFMIGYVFGWLAALVWNALHPLNAVDASEYEFED